MDPRNHTPNGLSQVLALLGTSVLVTVAVAALPSSSAAAVPPAGALTQLAGIDGCVSDSGATGDQSCARGNGLSGPTSVLVTPDGKNVYLAAYGGAGGVGILSRDLVSGKLTQLPGTEGCISINGSLEGCAEDPDSALAGADGLAASPDGNNIYAVSAEDQGSVAVFERHPDTGALSAAGPTTHVLENLTSVAVSPDGNNIYMTSGSASAVAVLQRDGNSGGLTQLPEPDGCIADTQYGGTPGCTGGRALQNPNSVAVSPDGKSVYVASSVSNAVAVFQREGSSGKLTQLSGTAGCIDTIVAGTCADGRALYNPTSVAVSPDGKNVYVASSVSNAVAVFTRDPVGGALTQSQGKDGCISEDGSYQTCTMGNGLVGAVSVAVSPDPDGKNVYVASRLSNAVAAFARGANGALTQLSGVDNCISEGGIAGCGSGKGLSYPSSVAVSPDGENTYVGSRSALAVFSRSSGEEPPPPTPTPAPAPSTAPNSTVAGPGVESVGRVVVQIRSRTVRLAGYGIAVVRLKCSADGGDRCVGALTLRTAKRIKAGGKRARKVTLGKGSFSIPGGETAQVKLRLSKTNQRLVARLKAVKANATASFTPTDIAGSGAGKITLKAPKPRARTRDR